MRNTLGDLNNYLFESLERLLADDLTNEEMEREISRSKAVTAVAETVIHNGELALKTMQHLNEYAYGSAGNDKNLVPVPAMLDVRNQ